ncbi:MAG: signal recognition particle protein [Alphaproteobacteria bacterium]|nr:signal recognition particle protein [Alphaproteobacteria bacterium]
MFEGLSGRLGEVLQRLTRRGALSEGDVAAAMREVRVALLEADVALPVVKGFIERVSEKAVGQAVLRSVSPGQMVIKLVHDELLAMLGGSSAELNLAAAPPVAVLMVGLQGSGKTTTTAKLAKRLTERDNKRVLMASLDTRRPAAMEQLATLGQQSGVATLPIVAGQAPVDIAKRALQAARLQGYDVVLLDTAGRQHVDQGLMAEVADVKAAAQPFETLLVADALTGQDAVNLATHFHERVGLTGIVLTRLDGDGRGGAALSMRAMTDLPIKLIGVGERLDALEPFHPDRIAGRILGMGDVVSLVERAAETIEKDDAERLAKKVQKGQFDLQDLLGQLRQIKKMGGLEGLMGMLPGVQQLKDKMADAKLDPRVLKRQEAIILSMTPAERRDPRVIHASRKRRIAAGSCTEVHEVNKLLKQHQQMQTMMKRVQKLGKTGMLRQGIAGLMGR